jgi:hypothetical protein
MHNFCNPLALLGRNIRGRAEPSGWDRPRKDEDLPVTGFSRILQLERLDLVLIQVREGDASVSLSDDVANVLDQR